MRNEPTFYQGMDWYGLVELGPAAREVLNLMLPACRPGRNGHIEHSVHVMAGWFAEATQHWGAPVTPSKARRGLNELIEKGVLTRHNEPQDGVGFVVTFNMNPPKDSNTPISGFRHAEEVSERCGSRAVFRRLDEGRDEIRLQTRRVAPSSGWGEPDPFSSNEVVEPEPEDSEFDLSGLDRLDAGIKEVPTGPMAEFASALEAVTSQNSEEKLRLMTGACQRVAEAVRPALERGWEPKALAHRLAAELNPKIHSPEKLLIKKAGDIGNSPPKASATGDKVLIKGKLVDLGAYDMGFGDDVAPRVEKAGPSLQEQKVLEDAETKEERLMRIARMAGRRTK